MAKRTSDLDRFWSKVDMTGECWLWTAAAVNSAKNQPDVYYGQFWATGRVHRAHRWLYGQLVAPLIEGSAIDHLCRTTLCVRPSHLEQVTQRENILRGVGTAAANARRTQCINGHEFTDANTMIRSGGKRRCRPCHEAEQAAWNLRRRAS